ncbi:MAG: DUF342 domain-containing protein [Dethiobacter sp.]|nr:DUF342 domain-containing protein [Dethiobacter sp.]
MAGQDYKTDAPDASQVEKSPVEIRISSDGLYASLKVKKQLDLGRIYELLSAAGVIYGIDHQAVETALSLFNGEWVVAATGLPPQPGADARLEVYFAVERTVILPEDGLEKIDYRDKGAVPSTVSETLLTKKVPAVPGKPGKTVTGKEIPAPPVKDIFLRAGKNTYFSNDKLQVFSAVLGRPLLDRQGRHYTITVEPVFSLNSDVDLSSGHIRFQGDIIIKGKVTESMEVHSGRSVQVFGSVNGALIKAEGAVSVRGNVINSSMLAGTRQYFGFQLYPYLVGFESTLAEILSAYQQIKSAPGYEDARFGFILDILVEKKFYGFRGQIEKLSQAAAIDFPHDFSKDLIYAVSSLTNQLNEFKRLPYQELNNAVELLQTAATVKKLLSINSADKCDINALYCLNSRLVASGKVTIAGQGCFHTDITSYDSIEINGVARGGTIRARKNIRVNTVGSEAAVVTNVIVPQDQAVFINKAFENTIVTVGESSYKFSSQRSRVKICFNKDTGRIDLAVF